MSDDPVLLRRFVREGDHDAFAALVQRHFDLVYSVAMRQVGGDVHLAKDAAQIVFAALARKAASLADRATLGGWLYRAAQFAAIDVVRAERRRRGYEQEAVAMKEISGERRDEVDWERVRPLLDRAIGELNEVDRDAVVMRFPHWGAATGATSRVHDAEVDALARRCVDLNGVFGGSAEDISEHGWRLATG